VPVRKGKKLGIRRGQDHGRAKLTDHEVELLRRMQEEGCAYRFLAMKFEISIGQVFNIVNYRQR